MNSMRPARVSMVALALAGGLAAASAAWSASRPATGKPIVLAMINQEQGYAAFPQMRLAALAAIKYANAHGGVHGRPLKLATCSADGTPATSASCANKLLDQHPVAAVPGVDLGADGSVPVFTKAGLAYIGGLPLTASSSTSKNSIQFTGGIGAAYPAFVVYAAKALHAKKVSIIYTNEPAGQFALNVYLLPTLKAEGITDVKSISQDPASTDWSASVAAAASSNPDVIITTTPPAACVSVMKTHKALGVGAKLYVTGGCGAPPLIAAAGDGAEGVYSVDDLALPSEVSNADVRLLLSIVKAYAPASLPLDEPAQIGVGEIINIWHTFNTIPAAKLTTASILTAFRTGANHPNFLGHPYTCNGKQVPGAPAICNAFVKVTVIHSGQIGLADSSWWRGP
jgi:branched-chain amino acid transport system substrate-binding protein